MRTLKSRITSYNLLFVLTIYVIMGIIATATATEAVKVQDGNYYYTDKLFGTHYSFTPKSDEVMVKFIPKAKSLKKAAQMTIAEQYNLETVQDAVAVYSFGVYKIPTGESIEMVIAQLKADEQVQTAFPAMIDQEGATRYFIPDEIVVQFEENISEPEIHEIIKSQRCKIKKDHWTPGFYTLLVPAGKDLFEMVRTFMDLPQIKFSELNFIDF